MAPPLACSVGVIASLPFFQKWSQRSTNQSEFLLLLEIKMRKDQENIIEKPEKLPKMMLLGGAVSRFADPLGLKKDPGVPNMFPLKESILLQAQEQKALVCEYRF